MHLLRSFAFLLVCCIAPQSSLWAQSVTLSDKLFTYEYDHCRSRDTSFLLVVSNTTVDTLSVLAIKYAVNLELRSYRSIIEPGDTLHIRLYPLANDSIGMTRVSGRIVTWTKDLHTNHREDTFFVDLMRHGPKLHSEDTAARITPYAGDTASKSFTVENHGDRPFTLDSIHIDIPGGWWIEGIAKGDVIAAGGSRVVQLKFSATGRGTFGTKIKLINDCHTLTFDAQAIVNGPKRARWLVGSMTDTLKSCPEAGGYKLQLLNSSPEATEIDSLSFDPQSSFGWSVPSVSGSFTLQPNSATAVVIQRDRFATNTRLVAHTRLGINDTLDLKVLVLGPHPKFKNGGDTVVIYLRPNDKLNFANDVENFGRSEYRLRKLLLLENSGGWSVVKFDTFAVLNFHDRTDVVLSFPGSSAEGDHSVTFRISGEPCDHELTRTLIARVVAADVNALGDEPDFEIYPTFAHSILNLKSGVAGEITIVDALGRTLHTGKINSGTSAIDIGGLPSGHFFLRLTSSGQTLERRFVISR
jgi:hypothetical protein